MILVVDTQRLVILHLHSTRCDEDNVDGRPEAKQYLCLRRRLSPALRSSAATTGKGLRRALESIAQPPASASIFESRLRRAEMDEYGARIRCEGLLAANKKDTWERGVLLCSGHHAAAEKTWLLHPLPSLLTGVVHIALYLQTLQALTRAAESLADELEHRPLEIILYQTCPDAAVMPQPSTGNTCYSYSRQQQQIKRGEGHSWNFVIGNRKQCLSTIAQVLVVAKMRLRRKKKVHYVLHGPYSKDLLFPCSEDVGELLQGSGCLRGCFDRSQPIPLAAGSEGKYVWNVR